jgi:hypothetical protein
LNLRPLGYEPPAPCPAVRTSSRPSHPVAAYAAGPSHGVSGIPARDTASYYSFYYGLRLAHPISITDMKRLPGSITEICQLAAGQSLAPTGELVTDGDESRRLRPRGIRRYARREASSASVQMKHSRAGESHPRAPCVIWLTPALVAIGRGSSRAAGGAHPPCGGHGHGHAALIGTMTRPSGQKRDGAHLETSHAERDANDRDAEHDAVDRGGQFDQVNASPDLRTGPRRRFSRRGGPS